MLLIIGIHSISVTGYNSIYVIFFLLPTCNIYRGPIVPEITKLTHEKAVALFVAG